MSETLRLCVVRAGQGAPHDPDVMETEPFPAAFQQVVHRILPCGFEPCRPLPQLTTMLKGLFRGWVSSVINEKANKDLRDAQIRDKPQKAQPFLLPPPVTSVTRESETRATQ